MSARDLYALSLNEYLERAASKSPTPGGGSVSAVTAAGAAAMVSMVADLTIGKKGYESCQEQAQRIHTAAVALIARLKTATTRDMEAFDALMAVWRLPAKTPEEKGAKESALEQAAERASQPPLETGRACVEILRLARELAPIGNRGAISDVGVAVYVAEAALKSALLSVEINLPMIHAPAVRADLDASCTTLLAQAEEHRTAALGAVKSRLA